MKALILDGSYKGDRTLDGARQMLIDELASQGWQVKPITLHGLRIRHCTGCFGCWLKTPGMCVIKDAGRGVAREVIQSDLVILFTPVTFGGYSSELKKAVDRFACSLLLPFFMKVGGEVHHVPRYKRLPRLMGVGVLPQADAESERIFTTLVHHNAINLHAPACASGVVTAHQQPEQMRAKIQSLFSEVLQ